MTKGFAPRLKLAVKSQAKRAEKRQLTPLSEIQANLLNCVAEFRGRQAPPNLYRQMFSRDRPASKNSAY